MSLNLQEPLTNSTDFGEINGQLDAPKLTIEKALELAGDKNRYQFRMTFIMALQMLFISFILQGQPFFFINPDFQCKNLSTGKFEICESKDFCSLKASDPSRVIIPTSPNTIVIKFELYCDRAIWLTLAQVFFFAFANFATLFFTVLADRIGRKITLSVSYIVGSVGFFLLSFSPNLIVFCILLAIAGIGSQPFIAILFVLISESGGEKTRQYSTITILIMWAIGQMVIVPLSYYFPDWQILLRYAVGIPMLLLIGGLYYIYESPKFLVSKRKFSEAKKVLLKIARINKKLFENENYEFADDPNYSESVVARTITQSNLELEYDEYSVMAEAMSDSIFSVPQKKARVSKKYTIIDLFRYRSMLKITIPLMMGYFAIYVSYFGSILALQSLGGNMYINAIYIDICELVIYLLAIPTVKHVKRKTAFGILYLLMTVCCLSLIFLKSDILKTIIGMMLRMVIASLFSIIYIFTTELYPITIRSVGFGLCEFVGKSGGAVAPILNYFFLYNLDINPIVSYALISIIPLLLFPLLHETKNAEMLEDIPELISKRVHPEEKVEVKSVKENK